MVLREVAWLVRTLGGVMPRRRRVRPAGVTPARSRELAEVMRSLPDRYADRLPPRTLRRVAEASPREWERAVKTTIFVLGSARCR